MDEPPRSPVARLKIALSRGQFMAEAEGVYAIAGLLACVVIAATVWWLGR